MCVALPTHVGAWSMTVLLGQPFEYHATCMYMGVYLGGALPVRSRLAIVKGEVGSGLPVARVSIPLRGRERGRQGEREGERGGEREREGGRERREISGTISRGMSSCTVR